MELVLCSFICLLTYMIGYLVGKLASEKRVKESLQNAIAAEIKAAKIGIIIRSHRNQLYRRETEIKELSRNREDLNSYDYYDVKSKLEIIKIIEEDIAKDIEEENTNEM